MMNSEGEDTQDPLEQSCKICAYALRSNTCKFEKDISTLENISFHFETRDTPI